MGILESIDSTYKGAVDSIIDNDTVSVQDTVRGGLMAATGQYGEGAEEFRSDSKAALNSVNAAINKPSQVVYEHTKGTPIDNEVVRRAEMGGELVYEQFVEYPGAVAYGSATGSDLRYEATEETATDYTPGVLDSLELAVFGGPISKGAATGGRAASKGARAVARSSDDAAKAAAGGGSSMGIVSTIRKAVSKSDEARDASRAADDTVGTQKTLDSYFANKPSAKAETLEDAAPDGAILDPLRDAARSRTNQAVVGGAFGLGALGVGASAASGSSGGVSDGALPDGYSVAGRINAAPGAVLVEQRDSDGNSLGYWVVLSSEGSGTYKALVKRGQGFGTRPVSFPTSSQPDFASRSQARSAFRTWAERARNTQSADDSGRPKSTGGGSSPWGNAEVVQPLNHGWYLAEQEHNTEDKYRYLVTGRGPNGGLLFVTSAGTASSSPQTYTTRDNAMAAYEAWVGTDNPSTAPDPAQDRPVSSDIVSALRGSGPFGSGGGGSLGAIGTVAAGGAAAALALLVYKLVIQ